MGIGLYALRKLFYIVEIDGCSMSPFLLSGDQVLVTRYFPKSLVKRGSVVLFTPWSMALPDQNNIYIKRVVGLPNDTLAIYETELIALKDVLSRDTYNFFASMFEPHSRIFQVTRVLDIYPVQINPKYSKNCRTEKVAPGHLFVKGDWLFGGDDLLTHGSIPFKKIIGVMLAKLDY